MGKHQKAGQALVRGKTHRRLSQAASSLKCSASAEDTAAVGLNSVLTDPRTGMAALICILLAFLVVPAVLSSGAGQPKLYGYKVIRELPHDPTAFTQGLEFAGSCQGDSKCKEKLWESTGMYGESSIREVELSSGKILREKRMATQDFGEGLVKIGNRLLQLTWLTPKAYSYHVDNFDDVRELRTPLRDGWGATSDGRSVIVSDGSSRLSWLDPQDLSLRRSVDVHDGIFPVKYLNELEYIDGSIWANVWMTDCIAIIQPKTGKVKAWLDMAGLRQNLQQENPQQRPVMDVLNGIAWDESKRELYVTGKYWSKLYEIKPMLQTASPTRQEVKAVRSRCILG
ncbi:hypothetical protein WJX74_000046 [Apatococcus lobatus]|uniref:Glutamine cyclotransferase n=2 Tax=Apatococcus TaxID=904362 RepID=A0AAW1T2Y1_9CHLO